MAGFLGGGLEGHLPAASNLKCLPGSLVFGKEILTISGLRIFWGEKKWQKAVGDVN